jgi:hypothetical protein
VAAEHRVEQPLAEDHDQRQRQEQCRNAHQHIHDPHQHHAEPREIGRQRAEQHAENEGDDHDADAGQERHPGAADDPREQVAAGMVGAEPVLRIGRGEARDGVDLLRVVGHDPGRQQGCGQHHHQEGEPEPRDLALAERHQEVEHRAHCSLTRGSR